MFFLHIPNESERSPMTWWVLKAMGFLKGAPDLIIAWVHRIPGYYDPPKPGEITGDTSPLNPVFRMLYIEFKSGDANRTPEQERFGRWCALHSYDYEVVRTFDRFVRLMGEHGIGA